MTEFLLQLNPYSDLIGAASTVFLCILTAIYVVYTKRALELQVRPDIAIMAVPDQIYPQIINFHIENIGAGIAKNLIFELEGDFPPLNRERDQESPFHFGPLTDGIRSMSPREKVVFLWDEFASLNEAIQDKQLSISCEYKSSFGKAYKDSYVISVKHYRLSFVRTAPQQQISDNLHRIAGLLHELNMRRR